MTELIAVALITILATISPGPDFAMVTRNSYLYGRSSGLLAALGIALGVQVVQANTPLAVQFGYGLFMSVTHFIWFGLVALFFSRQAFRSRIVNHQAAVDRLIGLVLMGLGTSLAFSNIGH